MTAFPDVHYIIRSDEEADDDGRPLFWSNEDGWTARAGATRFTWEERHFGVDLPFGGAWRLTDS